MTNCSGKQADEFLESYLTGTLPEAESQRFEEHYFDCPVCLAQVEALQAVAHELRKRPVSVADSPTRPVLRWPARVASLGAVAALLAIGFYVFHAHKQQPPTSAVATVPAAPAQGSGPAAQAPAAASPKVPAAAQLALAHLADLTLPPFRGATLRGESRDAHFTAGMKSYAEKNCPQAIASLAQVPADDPDAAGARLYKGACQAHDGDMAGSAKTLRAVADAGDSPQQEAALYYLAQVALAQNDAAASRRYLSRTIALRGDFERRARAQLAAIQTAGNKQ